MKLMKRILAIVCTFVMIISMATGVNAVDNTSAAAATQPKGSITLENAVVGDEYKVYKILTLESYVKDKAYSYKRNGDGWDKFINSTQGTQFFESNENGYVKLKSTADNNTAARKIAIYAIGFAQANRDTVTPTKTVRAEATSKTETTKVVFNDLELGYYVVESTSGTACAITTTDPDATIKDKHDNPSVNKIIEHGGVVKDNHKMNSVNLGETVYFETTINVKPGAKNYVLHDTMDSNLENFFVYEVYCNLPNSKNQNTSLATTGAENEKMVNVRPGAFNSEKPTDGCTFELSFTNLFYTTYRQQIDRGELTKIYVKYYATVGNKAPINTAMKNTTYLTYGENNLETDKSETETYTYGIPVFKYTGTNTPLADAKFILSKVENATEADAIKFTSNGAFYRYTIDQTNGGGNTTLVSPTEGRFEIQGLEAGTYYLKETEAPKGYNKIQKSIKIEILEDGSIKVDNNAITGDVRVQNNTGSILPSTGGMGTTLIYVVGSILVLASGIVLFSKRKEGTN